MQFVIFLCEADTKKEHKKDTTDKKGKKDKKDDKMDKTGEKDKRKSVDEDTKHKSKKNKAEDAKNEGKRAKKANDSLECKATGAISNICIHASVLQQLIKRSLSQEQNDCSIVCCLFALCYSTEV